MLVNDPNAFEKIQAEMFEWLEGSRSYHNYIGLPGYTPDVVAIMDAQEVVKRAEILKVYIAAGWKP